VPHYQPAVPFQCHIINQQYYFSATLSTSIIIWVPHYQPAVLFQCHIINQQYHFSATLSTSSIIWVPHYQPAVLFRCHIINQQYYFSATLSTRSTISVPHYQPAVLFEYHIINQQYYFGATLLTSSIISVPHYQPAVPFQCHIINQQYYCSATLSTSSTISVPHYQPALLFQCHIINQQYYFSPHYQTALWHCPSLPQYWPDLTNMSVPDDLLLLTVDAIKHTNFCSCWYVAPASRRRPACLSFLTSHLVWSLRTGTHVRINVSFHDLMEAFSHAPLLPTRPATIATSSCSLSLLTRDSMGDGGWANCGCWAPWGLSFWKH